MGAEITPHFNIVDFYDRYLIDKMFEGKGVLELVKMVEGALKGPAFVKFKPFRVHVCEDVLECAIYGDDEARFILAHEMGHIALHDHNVKFFSKEDLRKPPSELKYFSAEWQADTFARHFLMPLHIVKSFHTAEELAEATQSPIRHARKQFALTNSPDKQQRADTVSRTLGGYVGDFCLKCGNYTRALSGTEMKCETCR